MTIGKERVQEALSILVDLGLPRAQQNERSALSLLAILDLTPTKSWAKCSAPLIGITPIMDWARDNYETKYKPNTRETFRRQTMHQFIEAGIALYNPDKPDRPVNSPAAVYQIEPNLLAVLKTFGTVHYQTRLKHYLAGRQTLIDKYARAREMNLIPVQMKDGQQLRLSAGEHSELIKAIVEDFGARYAAGGELIYVGDTGEKFGYFDEERLASLSVNVDSHGKMPDVVIYLPTQLKTLKNSALPLPWLHEKWLVKRGFEAHASYRVQENEFIVSPIAQNSDLPKVSCVYAFCMAGRVIRIGETIDFKKRMGDFNYHVSRRLRGQDSGTTQAEADGWRSLGMRHDFGVVLMREFYLIRSPIGFLNPRLSVEEFLINHFRNPLNNEDRHPYRPRIVTFLCKAEARAETRSASVTTPPPSQSATLSL